MLLQTIRANKNFVKAFDFFSAIFLMKTWLQTECLCPPNVHTMKLNTQCDSIWRGTHGR